MSLRLFEDFEEGIGPHWQRVEAGAGRLEWTGSSLRCVNQANADEHYSNAQIDDYRHLRRNAYPWKPPLRFEVRARFSHDTPHGTAGFGFWNEPFLSSDLRMPALPQAIWFFYASPPSDMTLALDVPGWGWKAATLDAGRMPFPLLFPTMPLMIPFMRVPSLYRRLWPGYQRAMHVCEAPVRAEMSEWHTYAIDWLADDARFQVDGAVVLECDAAPRGPLGLVIWLDNRWMVATPQGQLRWGLVQRHDREWMELDWVRVVGYDNK